MADLHFHKWQVRREWVDEDGRWLRHRSCNGCSLEQQFRYVISEMTWTLFRQWDPLNQGPIFDRRRHFVECVIS